MMMFRLKFLLVVWLCGITILQAQTGDDILRMDEFRMPKKRQIIRIPDVGHYRVLKCDFHMHTVFSDGHVWPFVRVQEAWTEGLDVFAITDHVEYKPNKNDLKAGNDRPWELVRDLAAENNLILIKGTEITRSTPPGHFNALFIGDASNYLDEYSSEMDEQAVRKAQEQNAFVFWNHPGWKASQVEGSYDWIPFVDKLTRDGVINGIEVFNGIGFYKKALDWCVDKNLTVMGNSDLHNLIGYEYNRDEYTHRTMTLVFAADRTEASVREALQAGRTVAWSSKYLAGKEENVRNLFHACVETGPRFHSKTVRNGKGTETTTDYYRISNHSDLYFEMDLKSGSGTAKVTLFPRSEQVITAPASQTSLTYEVVTAFIRSDKNLTVEIPLK